MAAVLTRLRTDLRARWRAWAAVALLIGITGGVVLTTATGARRTDTAYARYLRRSHAADVLVSPSNRGVPDYYPALAKLPSVAELGIGVGFEAFVRGATAPPGAPVSPTLGAGFQVLAAADTRLGSAVEKPKVTDGRMFRPDRADEVVADIALAKAMHLHAGSALHFIVASTNENGVDVNTARPETVKVVGIVVSRNNVVPVNALASSPTLLAGPEFTRTFADNYELYSAFDGAFIRLKPGASKAAFARDAEDLAAKYGDETGAPDGPIFVADEREQARTVERAIRPQATALALFS